MSIYDRLNDQQKEAVFTVDGPLLLLAGAGSGKTGVLTHRIAYMIEGAGVDPWNILAVTFTNKAAGEMRERVDSLIGFGSDSIWVATFHSTCVRILRRYADRIGYDNNFTIYDTSDQKTVISEILKKLSIDPKQLREKSVMQEISSAKDELISAEEYVRNAGSDYRLKKIASVYTEYQRVMRKNNAMDFDDLICKTVELFKTCPEVLEQYRNRFQYIMVDEYQDTNTAQFEFIRLLAEKYRNLCVVGDDDQSIYRFRGANIHNILDFEKNYPDAKTIKLEQNYRSTQIILDAANGVIRNNKGRKKKTLWTAKEGGNLIHFRQFDTAYEEAEFLACDIQSKVDKNEVNYQDCTILYRTNAQSRLLEERFVHDNIPYKIIGGVNFYSRKEIKDILAYLKTVDNGKDDLAVKRIINVPKRGIGSTTILKVQNYADQNDMGFFQALLDSGWIPEVAKSAEKLGRFSNMIRVFRVKSEYMGIADLTREILDTVGYLTELEESEDPEDKERIENIDEFINKIVDYEKEHEQDATLSGFLEEVALVSDIDSMDASDNRVMMMTLHSAKGLEFPHVYIAGMEEGVFPSSMSTMSEDSEDIEEERRLAYVGITRAKMDLTITCARMRMIHGETQINSVSRFLREIPPELLDGNINGRKKTEYQDSMQSSSGWNNPYRPSTKTYDTSNQYTEEPSTFRDTARIYSKPSAVLKKQTTAEKNKPFLARGIDVYQKAESDSELGYEVGDRVKHIRFGVGTVLEIEEASRDYQITVEFDTAGRKVMYAAFAKLKKADET